MQENESHTLQMQKNTKLYILQMQESNSHTHYKCKKVHIFTYTKKQYQTLNKRM